MSSIVHAEKNADIWPLPDIRVVAYSLRYDSENDHVQQVMVDYVYL